MKPTLAALLALALSGCATIQATNDRAIDAWKAAGCAMPLSAILRNPEVIPALNTLCKPASGLAQPSDVVGK